MALTAQASPAERRRLLHLCRGEVPPAAVGEVDLVVHAGAAGWELPGGEPVSDARLVELLFEADLVAAW